MAVTKTKVKTEPPDLTFEQVVKQLNKDYFNLLVDEKLELLNEHSKHSIDGSEWPLGEYTRTIMKNREWVRRICELPYVKVVELIEIKGTGRFFSGVNANEVYNKIVETWTLLQQDIYIVNYQHLFNKGEKGFEGTNKMVIPWGTSEDVLGFK